MFSQKELKQIARKKRTIVARSDALRKEANEIWSVAERRAVAAESRLARLRWLPPVVSLLATGATIYLKTRPVRGGKVLEPLLSIAAAAMNNAKKPAARPRVPVSRRLEP